MFKNVFIQTQKIMILSLTGSENQKRFLFVHVVQDMDLNSLQLSVKSSVKLLQKIKKINNKQKLNK